MLSISFHLVSLNYIDIMLEFICPVHHTIQRIQLIPPYLVKMKQQYSMNYPVPPFTDCREYGYIPQYLLRKNDLLKT